MSKPAIKNSDSIIRGFCNNTKKPQTHYQVNTNFYLIKCEISSEQHSEIDFILLYSIFRR